MLSITVDAKQKYPQIRWPRELMTEGFSGTLPVLNDSITLVILHPAASLEQVKKSLELKVKDVELRIEKARNNIAEDKKDTLPNYGKDSA